MCCNCLSMHQVDCASIRTGLGSHLVACHLEEAFAPLLASVAEQAVLEWGQAQGNPAAWKETWQHA